MGALHMRRLNLSHLVLHGLLIAGAVAMLMPFIWMVSTSLKAPGELLRATPTFWPESWRWQNYPEVFRLVPFRRFYLNTIIVTVARVTGQVLLSSLAAY